MTSNQKLTKNKRNYIEQILIENHYVKFFSTNLNLLISEKMNLTKYCIKTRNFITKN